MEVKIVKNCVIIISFLISCIAFSDGLNLENVPKDYIGTYAPMQYNNMLLATRSHYEAMSTNENQYHDILLLQEDICYSNSGFHDGYAISREEFAEFRFAVNSNGMYIIDGNGNSYKKISGNTGRSGYNDFESYVIRIIFEDAQYLKNITLDNNKIIIDNVEYSIILDSLFFETENVSIWLRGNRKVYALIIDGISAKIFESRNEQISTLVSDHEFKYFPMFYWNDARYPKLRLWDIPISDLKYIRNLIYAKHGYVFQSKDLKELYESFSWYSKNPAFSENDFSNDENQLLENVIKRER